MRRDIPETDIPETNIPVEKRRNNIRRALASNLLLTLLLTLCLGRLWLVPLASGFWTDELGTVFVVHHGAADPSLRAAPQVPDSVYYLLPALAEKLFGFSEISYRLPSLLAMAAALFLIAKLAGRLIHPLSPWFAIFACLSATGFNFQAADARPYALGTLCLAFALWQLVLWMDSGRWRHALLFAAAAGALWWVHLIFWPFYLLFIAYGGYRLVTRDTNARPAQVAFAAAAILVACLPVALRALSLFHGAAAHVIMPPPTWRALSSVLKPWIVGLACLVPAFATFRLAAPRPAARRLAPAAGILIMSWWLLDPLLLFALSRATGNSMFVARYMYLAIPGLVLAATAATSLFLPERFWKPLAALLALAVLLFGGHWREAWPLHQNSDWRSASQDLRAWVAGNNAVPVLCPSPFIEAKPPVWTPGYPLSGFLYSHLAVYPHAGALYPLPFGEELPPEATAFAARLLAGSLRTQGRFALYGGDRNVNAWRDWFAARPELSLWRHAPLSRRGDVEIVVFTRP